MRILIIDDDIRFCHVMERGLKAAGHEVAVVCDPEEIFRGIHTGGAPDLVLCDWEFPTCDGIDVLRFARSHFTDAAFIIATAYATIESAIASFQEGAVDYLMKPVMLDDLLFKIRRLGEIKSIEFENRLLRRQLRLHEPTRTLIGESTAMTEVIELARRVATHPTPVLIHGESGTGKELVARAIHDSSRADRAFVAFNCAALPEHLIESQLFGHVKGAFTGATDNHVGFLEAAGDGTVFLDEIGDASLGVQAKLLRTLAQKTVLRIGDVKERPIAARFIFATNQDLDARVREGAFREDLLFRIKVFQIDLPPLRDRLRDLPLLVDHFIHTLNVDMKTRVTGISPDALHLMQHYSWPGNVRELRNAVERAMIFAGDGPILTEHLPAMGRGSRGMPSPADPADEVLDLKTATRRFEQQHIHRVLELTNFNRTEAAKVLRIDRKTLYRKLGDSEPGDSCESAESSDA